eukprot:TRINITY_DN823_c0_g1_i2.p1 TRINITY_DN823_c0_g1~~TRINITY_DN823_c0_g1_i2.p1  ORF type:complete len:260 (-),score=76.47 TRINITY_DN823_c0_g1_i2:186-965(-)
MAKLTKQEFAVFKEDFDEFDTDSNGLIDGEELRALANKQLDRECTDTEFAEFLKSIDLNADGKVDLEEYISSIVGKGWEAEGRLPRTRVIMADMPAEAERVFNELGLIPLICGKDEDARSGVGTYWNYAGGVTVVDTKALVIKSIGNDPMKAAEGSEILGAATRAAMEHGNWLVLHMQNGACNLMAFDDNEEFPVELVLDAKTEKDPKAYPDVESKHDIVVHEDYKVLAVTLFEESEVEEFLGYALPLAKFHLVVVATN